MGKDSSYFQFPLCLLARRPDEEWGKRMSIIIGHSIISYAIKSEILAAGEITSAGDILSMSLHEEEGAYQKIRQALNFTGGSLRPSICAWKQAEALVASYCARFPHGLGLVRIRSDIAFESRDGSFPEREFRVLAAIYSKIGSRDAVQITRDEIIRRSSGCVSKSVFETWESKAASYTPKEVRLTVDQLEARSLFRTCIYNRRQKFFSHGLNEDALREAVFQLKTNRDEGKEAKRRKDAEMTARIIATKRPESETTKGPMEGRNEGHLYRKAKDRATLMEGQATAATGAKP